MGKDKSSKKKEIESSDEASSELSSESLEKKNYFISSNSNTMVDVFGYILKPYGKKLLTESEYKKIEENIKYLDHWVNHGKS